MSQSFEHEPNNAANVPDTIEPTQSSSTEGPDQFLEKLQRIPVGLETIGTMGIASTVHTSPKDGSKPEFKGLIFHDIKREYAYGIDSTGTKAYRTKIADPNRAAGYTISLAPVLREDGYIKSTDTHIQAATKENGIREAAYATLTEQVAQYKDQQAWIDAGRQQALSIIQSVGL